MQRQARRNDLNSPATQARRSIGAQLGIDEQRRVQVQIVAETLRVERVAVAFDDQLGAQLANPGKRVTQLRDLFAAEQSTEVPDEDENDASLLPKRSEQHVPPVGVAEDDRSELVGQPHVGDDHFKNRVAKGSATLQPRLASRRAGD